MITFLIFLIAPAFVDQPDTDIKGAWQLVKSQYGNEAAKTDYEQQGIVFIKMFTGSRWSAVSYDQHNTIGISDGGHYVIHGDEYVETVDYFSSDTGVVGKTFHFTLRMENGLLHQHGTMEYKGNPKYLVDEWFRRLD